MDQLSKMVPDDRNQSLPATLRETTEGSFSSRISKSTSRLFGDLLTRPYSYDEVSTMALTSEIGNKGSSSNLEPPFQNNFLSPAYERNDGHRIIFPPNGDRIRPQQQNNAGNAKGLEAELENFMSGSKPHLGLDQGFHSFEDRAFPSHPELRSCSVKEGKRRAVSPHESALKQVVEDSMDLCNNEADGAAIVALLSEPSFSSSQMIDNMEYEDSGDEGNIPQTGSLPKLYTCPIPSNRFSLLPNFNDDEKMVKTEQALLDNDETYFRLLSPDLDFSDNGLLPWINMLDFYHDQVWGSMLPPIQKSYSKVPAKEESNENFPENSTIERLAMILRHIRL